MKPRHAVLALVVLAVAVTLTSVAAAGPDAAKQRVAITMKNLPDGEFVLTPLQAGALKRDSGTTSVVLKGPDVVMRDGQTIELWRGTWTLKGKRGTFTIREQISWVDTGDAFIGFGTWKVVGGTGEYTHVIGGGRTASVGHNHGNGNWFIREEGYLTLP
jgi:hypothetical protein